MQLEKPISGLVCYNTNTTCMRMKGENQGKGETQKQVLTSNQICCIDLATLALEQIRETAALPSGTRGSPGPGGCGGAPRAAQTGGRDAHTRARPRGCAPLRSAAPTGCAAWARGDIAHHGGCRSHTIPISNKMRIPEQAGELMSCPRWKAVFQLTTAAPTSFQQREHGAEG